MILTTSAGRLVILVMLAIRHYDEEDMKFYVVLSKKLKLIGD
jgi:hypothetical protein